MAQLREDYLVRPASMRLAAHHPRYAEIAVRHAAAVGHGDSGLNVFTAAFLADRGSCCESGCRHCPYVAD